MSLNDNNPENGFWENDNYLKSEHTSRMWPLSNVPKVLSCEGIHKFEQDQNILPEMVTRHTQGSRWKACHGLQLAIHNIHDIKVTDLTRIVWTRVLTEVPYKARPCNQMAEEGNQQWVNCFSSWLYSETLWQATTLYQRFCNWEFKLINGLSRSFTKLSGKMEKIQMNCIVSSPCKCWVTVDIDSLII